MSDRAAKPLPATPRKRVPRARTLVTTGASVRNAIAACAGRALTAFTLAQIAVLQIDADFREEPPRLDNESDSAPAKPWQTFENLVSDAPEKRTTAPVTVATEVKMACAALLIAVADLVGHCEKLPTAEPLTALGQTAWREANVVRLMAAATAKMRPLLRQSPLCRDLEYPTAFRRKFEAIAGSESLVDPGADQIARLYVDFLKVIAWHAGVQAYEGEHLTLNLVAFYSILASLQGAVPEEDGPTVRDVLNLVRGQVEQWSAARARANAAKKKPAPRRAPARPAAKPAALPPTSASTAKAANAARAAPAGDGLSTKEAADPPKKAAAPAGKATAPAREAAALAKAEAAALAKAEAEAATLAKAEAEAAALAEAEAEAAALAEAEAEAAEAEGGEGGAARPVAPALDYDALELEIDRI